MLRSELLQELSRLSHTDKLRLVQLLVNELAAEEESLLQSGTHYEVWSPFDAAGAAQTLLGMLGKEEEQSDG